MTGRRRRHLIFRPSLNLPCSYILLPNSRQGFSTTSCCTLLVTTAAPSRCRNPLVKARFLPSNFCALLENYSRISTSFVILLPLDSFSRSTRRQIFLVLFLRHPKPSLANRSGNSPIGSRETDRKNFLFLALVR